jgi:hypothetical protein
MAVNDEVMEPREGDGTEIKYVIDSGPGPKVIDDKPVRLRRRRTKEEQRKIVEEVASYLGERLRAHEIVQVLKLKHGLEKRHAMRYVAYARELLLKRSNRPPETFLADALAFYENIIRDPKHDITIKVVAQNELLKLFGKRRLENSVGADRECHVVEVLVTSRAEARDFVALPHDATVGSIAPTVEPTSAPSVEVAPKAPIQEEEPDDEDDEPPPTNAFGDPLPRRKK